MHPPSPDQTHGVRLLWVAGPPFTQGLLRGAAERAGGELLPLLEAGGRNDVASVAKRLAGRVAVDEGTVLVAHGLAVPAAMLAARRGRPGLRGLVLTNGPITRLDAFSAAFARSASVLSRAPGAVYTRWLASSAGLRRTVANPYVMDRDTVAAICGPLFADAGQRRAVADYVRSLAPMPAFAAPGVPVALIWGDDDPLYPLAEADAADVLLGGGRVRAIPGGRFGHPEERPWALADAVTAFCETLATNPAR